MADELPFESQFNEHLLECMMKDEIPEEYREIINKYVKEYGNILLEFTDVLGSTQDMLEMVLLRYTSDRLRDEVDVLCRKLKFTQDMPERKVLLDQLGRKKTRQVMVAEHLEGLGKVLE